MKMCAVVGMLGKAPVLLLEDPGVVALDGTAVLVVPAVPVHGINEEKAENFDPPRTKPLLLVEMLPDRPANHLALYRKGFHVAPGVSRPEIVLTARHAQFDELVPLLHADLAHAAVAIERAPSDPFEIIPVLNVDFAALDPAGRLDIELDLGTDHASPVARRHQADIGPVVGVLDRGRRDLDLLHQLALVGVHRIEPVDHVMSVRVCRRVAQRAERVHGPESLLPAPGKTPVHALGLVHDQDGSRRPDEINRLLAARLLAVLVEVVDVLLVDGADRDHHDLDLRAGREVPDLAELRRVVEEVLEGRTRVEYPEVVLGDPERFVDPFLDRNRRHDDDELGEAVALCAARRSCVGRRRSCRSPSPSPQ